MTDEETKLLKKFQKMIQRKGWNTFDSIDGTAWFGGKSHSVLLDCGPEKVDSNLEDYDFLVVGWANITKERR